jgi:Arc/MetJ-type ribon-helix-helix transcriptional regulator
MPNQRASGQKAVIVMMSEDFLSLIDGSLSALGFSDRSSFIREAVRAKLGATPQVAAAPSRAGKGGRPRKSDVPLVAEEAVPYTLQKKTP